jgi:hypothetical protein
MYNTTYQRRHGFLFLISMVCNCGKALHCLVYGRGNSPDLLDICLTWPQHFNASTTVVQRCKQVRSSISRQNQWCISSSALGEGILKPGFVLGYRTRPSSDMSTTAITAILPSHRTPRGDGHTRLEPTGSWREHKYSHQATAARMATTNIFHAAQYM